MFLHFCVSVGLCILFIWVYMRDLCNLAAQVSVTDRGHSSYVFLVVPVCVSVVRVVDSGCERI